MYEYSAKVIRIIDGDTIELDIDLGFTLHIHQRCRLYGIDAPEVRTRDLEEKERGMKAKFWITHQLLNKEVKVKTYKDDKYGRMLAEIFYNGENVNEDMIKRGLAKKYRP
jgi:micrococcal nuclease